MPAPVVVSDLQLLARSSLFCVEKGGFNSLAYWAGMNTGLNLAWAYSHRNIVSPDPKIWTLLAGIDRPRPSTVEYVSLLDEYTRGRFDFNTIFFTEPGLRYGEPGEYYQAGISDAVRVGIKEVPLLFRYLDGDDWSLNVLNWITEKLLWSKYCLLTEKREKK